MEQYDENTIEASFRTEFTVKNTEVAITALWFKRPERGWVSPYTNHYGKKKIWGVYLFKHLCLAFRFDRMSPIY